MSAWAVWVTMVSQGLSYFYFQLDCRVLFRQFQIDPRNGRVRPFVILFLRKLAVYAVFLTKVFQQIGTINSLPPVSLLLKPL